MQRRPGVAGSWDGLGRARALPWPAAACSRLGRQAGGRPWAERSLAWRLPRFASSPGPPSRPPRPGKDSALGGRRSSVPVLFLRRHWAFAVGLVPLPGATESASRGHRGSPQVRGFVTLQLFLWKENYFSVSNYVERMLLHFRLRGRQRQSDVLPRVATARERPPAPGPRAR